MNESSLYVDVVQTVDELKHYFSDVPLVMRAAEMIESLFEQCESWRDNCRAYERENLEQEEEILKLRREREALTG